MANILLWLVGLDVSKTRNMVKAFIFFPAVHGYTFLDGHPLFAILPPIVDSGFSGWSISGLRGRWIEPHPSLSAPTKLSPPVRILGVFWFGDCRTILHCRPLCFVTTFGESDPAPASRGNVKVSGCIVFGRHVGQAN